MARAARADQVAPQQEKEGKMSPLWHPQALGVQYMTAGTGAGGQAGPGNLARVDNEHDQGLFMAMVTGVTMTRIILQQAVFLNKEKLVPVSHGQAAT